MLVRNYFVTHFSSSLCLFTSLLEFTWKACREDNDDDDAETQAFFYDMINFKNERTAEFLGVQLSNLIVTSEFFLFDTSLLRTQVEDTLAANENVDYGYDPVLYPEGYLFPDNQLGLDEEARETYCPISCDLTSNL